MCCGLFILNFHFYVVCYLCVKCKSHLIEKKKKNLRTIEITPLVVKGSQTVWDGSICQKWVNHWHGSWNVGVSLVDNANKSDGFLRTCVDFLRASAVETLTFCALSVCK